MKIKFWVNDKLKKEYKSTNSFEWIVKNNLGDFMPYGIIKSDDGEWIYLEGGRAVLYQTQGKKLKIGEKLISGEWTQEGGEEIWNLKLYTLLAGEKKLSVFLQGNHLKKIYLGNREIEKVYLGNNELSSVKEPPIIVGTPLLMGNWTAPGYWADLISYQENEKWKIINREEIKTRGGVLVQPFSRVGSRMEVFGSPNSGSERTVSKYSFATLLYIQRGTVFLHHKASNYEFKLELDGIGTLILSIRRNNEQRERKYIKTGVAEGWHSIGFSRRRVSDSSSRYLFIFLDGERVSGDRYKRGDSSIEFTRVGLIAGEEKEMYILSRSWLDTTYQSMDRNSLCDTLNTIKQLITIGGKSALMYALMAKDMSNINFGS